MHIVLILNIVINFIHLSDIDTKINSEINILTSKTNTTTTKDSINKNIKSSENNNLNYNNICKTEIENNICLNNKILTSYKLDNNLKYYFKFDNELLQSSVNIKNILKGNFVSGVDMIGIGSSAFFSKSNYLYLDNNPTLNVLPLTISFYININNKVNKNNDNYVNGIYCPIFIKGEDNFKSNSIIRNPGLFINESSLKLKLSFANNNGLNKSIETLGHLNANIWNNIVITVTEKKAKIYVNGVLDAILLIENGDFSKNDYPFYIGFPKEYKDICNIEYSIDELKIYERELKTYDIQASSGNLFGDLEPDYLKIGCINCDFENAILSCYNNNYHLCTDLELQSGGLLFSHKMGWDNLGKPISYSQESENSVTKGLGLCCKN